MFEWGCMKKVALEAILRDKNKIIYSMFVQIKHFN